MSDQEDNFQSPLPWRNIVSDSDKSDKRSRLKMEESDADSCNSWISVKGSKKSKTSDNSVVNLLHKVGSEGASPGKGENVAGPSSNSSPMEAEIDGKLAELKESLGKIRETGRDLKNLFAEGPLSSRPTGKLLANTLEQHLAQALKAHKSIELLRIVKSLTFRESATQVTPAKNENSANIGEKGGKTTVKARGKNIKQTSITTRNKDRESRTPASPRTGIQGEWVEINKKKEGEEIRRGQEKAGIRGQKTKRKIRKR